MRTVKTTIHNKNCTLFDTDVCTCEQVMIEGYGSHNHQFQEMSPGFGQCRCGEQKRIPWPYDEAKKG